MFTKVFLEEFKLNPPVLDERRALAENQGGYFEACETLGINSKRPYIRIDSKIKGNPVERHTDNRVQCCSATGRFDLCKISRSLEMTGLMWDFS